MIFVHFWAHNLGEFNMDMHMHMDPHTAPKYGFLQEAWLSYSFSCAPLPAVGERSARTI